MKSNKNQEIVMYLIVGILTTIVSLVTYFITINIIFSSKTDLNIQISNVISWVFAVIFAYVMNKIIVFKSKTKGKEQKKEFINFVISRIVTLLLDMGIMFVMVTLASVSDTIAKLFVQVVVTVSNYVLSKIIVFKKGKE